MISLSYVYMSHRMFFGISACGFALLWVPQIEAMPSTQLPPPTNNLAELTRSQTLYLELIINGYSTQTVTPVQLINGQYAVPKGVLAKLDLKILVDGVDVLAAVRQASTVAQSSSLNVNERGGEWLALATVAQAQVQYDSAQQKLMLTLPPQWLPEQMFGRDYWYRR